MELSKRLYAVAGLVTEGASVADVGTDHGYIPIYLMEKGIASKALALDLNEGPIERARLHIRACGFGDVIEARQSDGLGSVKPGEADTMIAAGMGGALIVRILSEGGETASSMKTFILQPQSEIDKVRRYLNGHGFCIEEEDMVCDGGKYYSVMRAVHGEQERYEEWEYRYGKRLLEGRHQVLLQYLKRELRIKRQILEELKKHGAAKRKEDRSRQLLYEIEDAHKALLYYGPEGLETFGGKEDAV